jgi:hypothetical protein
MSAILKKPNKEIPLEIWKEIEYFLYDIAEGYDCDSDAHRYNTRCRKCEADKLRDLIKQNENN